LLPGARICVHITQQEAGAALCTSLLLQLLHGTNPKQRALLRTLSPCFQRDVSRAPIIGDFCLHKDSSRRSIASRAGADKVLGGGMFSRDAEASCAWIMLRRPADPTPT
jgi:hypothetical protein